VDIDGLDWLYPGPDECTLCHTEVVDLEAADVVDALIGGLFGCP